ncbi:MAG: ubiquinol-cytochrome c reductase iron-sulfur subunit, partial [Actinomycetota bacterium]
GHGARHFWEAMLTDHGNGIPHEPFGAYSGPRAHDPEPAGEHDPKAITRTRFLTGVAVAGGGVMTAAILVPVVGFAVAPTLQGEDYRWVDIGALGTDVPVGAVTSIAVSGPDPEADRRVFVRIKEKEGVKERLGKQPTDAVTLEELQPADLEIIAIWNRCAHLGCPVTYSRGGDNYICPCHGGAYDSRGRVTAGPPPRPLDRMDVKIVDKAGKDVALEQALTKSAGGTVEVKPDGFRVLIGRPYSVNNEEEPFELHGPGEPLDGALANLYPLPRP